MTYHIILQGKLYRVALNNIEPEIEERGTAPNFPVPYVVLGEVLQVPEDFREMVKYFCSKGQPIFPTSEGFAFGDFKEWKADEELKLKRKAIAEKIAHELSISEEYHTRINGYFVHTITPDYLILKRGRLIPVFIGSQEGDIHEIHKDRIEGSFLNGDIRYERLPRENGITLVAY